VSHVTVINRRVGSSANEDLDPAQAARGRHPPTRRADDVMNPLTCQAAVYSMASGIRGPRDGPPGPPHRGTVECVAYPKRLRVIRPPLAEYHSPSVVSSVTQNCHPRAASFCPSRCRVAGARSGQLVRRGAAYRPLGALLSPSDLRCRRVMPEGQCCRPPAARPPAARPSRRRSTPLEERSPRIEGA
jgi:hypothetical protein